MDNQEALKILINFKNWRKGADTEMPQPANIGSALLLAIDALRCSSASGDSWISVEDRLPGFENEMCLAVNMRGIVENVRHYKDGRFIDNEGNDFFATHWQPLPSPPITK